MNALAKLFEAVAPSLGAPPDQLEAVDGRIRVKGNPDKGMTWQQACQKLGVNTIVEMGENDPQASPRASTPAARRACRWPTFPSISKPAA